MPRNIVIRDYATARAALTHPDLSRHPSLRGSTEPLEQHVLNATGNDHARQRRAVTAVLDQRTPVILPELRLAVSALLEVLPRGETVDAGRRYAHPLALATAGLLVEITDPAELAWWQRVALAVDANRISAGALAAVRQRAGGRAGEGWDLGGAELAANVFFMFLSAYTNVTNVLGGALLALGRHPDQYAWLAADPRHRVANATDELLRYAEPPGRSSLRVAAAEVDLGTVRVRRGDTLRIARGYANRDPARYPDPDRLDLARAPGGQLTLGFGPHYCPASALTRFLLDFTLLGLVQRFSSIDAGAGPAPHWDLHGGAPLPLTFT